MTTTLALLIAACADKDALTFKVNGHKVKIIDDCGGSFDDGQWFVVGHEFGPTHLIHAYNYSDAYDAWLDESPTIPEEELPEAYGVPDSPEMAAWQETHPAPNYWEREAWGAWCNAKHVEERRIFRQWGEDADAGLREHPELIEGYQYQSNSSGTGIVSVSDYEWLNEADPEQIEVELADDSDD